jgi:hypothetical protein
MLQRLSPKTSKHFYVFHAFHMLCSSNRPLLDYPSDEEYKPQNCSSRNFPKRLIAYAILCPNIINRRREKDSEKICNISCPLNIPALDFLVSILLVLHSFSLFLDICNLLHFRKLYDLNLYLFDFIVHPGNQT